MVSGRNFIPAVAAVESQAGFAAVDSEAAGLPAAVAPAERQAVVAWRAARLMVEQAFLQAWAPGPAVQGWPCRLARGP